MSAPETRPVRMLAAPGGGWGGVSISRLSAHAYVGASVL